MSRVISDRFPFVEVVWEVRGLRGQSLAFMDTSFDGFLMLPAEWLPLLGTPDRVDWWQLADGSHVAAPTYFGKFRIVGIDIIVDGSLVVMGSEIVVGLDLLRHFLVILERGQRVIVEP
jgi:predicted aspartyl protease